MSQFNVNVFTAQDILGRYLRGSMRVMPDAGFFDLGYALDEHDASKILSAIVQEKSAPFVLTTTHNGTEIIDGIKRFKTLAGALLRPEAREDLDMPQFFDAMTLANLNTRDCLKIFPLPPGGPAWVKTSAILDTFDWTAWREALQASDLREAEIKQILRDADAAARTIMDFRVILMQAPAGLDRHDLRMLRQDMNAKLPH